MGNRSAEKTPMPALSPEVRCQSFAEVALGYSPADAVAEAERCLHCPGRPCVSGCPVSVQIPDFLEKLAAGDFAGAYAVIAASNCLPAVCGRVCPQENQCEGQCVRGKKGEPVAIGRLERFAADWHLQHGETASSTPAPNGHRAAVVGSGPASLACAGELARRGYAVTVFEAFHQPGGVLLYGIPEFRLPKAIVSREIENLRRLGVRFVPDFVVGRTASVEELLQNGFEAVFLGTGAGLPNFMGIPGENLNGVLSANEFLTRINLMGAYREGAATPVLRAKQVAVVGGGNVAMDAARCARRLGSEVTILYRRSEAELPARREEVLHAKEEGIAFRMLTTPVRLIGDAEGRVRGGICVKMQLGEPDASGRRRPVEIPGSEYEITADCFLIALGTSPNPLLRQATPSLPVDSHGHILADADGATALPGVFAGGDAVTGAATVILAMGAGKQAAAAMDRYIREKK